MSTPQNPYDPNRGSGDGTNDPNSANSSHGNADRAPQYGSQSHGDQAPQYGQNQNSGQNYDQNPSYGQAHDSTPQGSQGSYDQTQNYGQTQSYGQDQNYGQSQPGYGQSYDQNQGYDANAQGYDPNAQGYDANQYGQQPAYSGAGYGGGDQFVPANPNADYGGYSAGSGGNTSKNIWGILALIGGILGVLLAFVFGSGFIFGVAAVVFGFIGLSAIKKGQANNKGLNITGLILGFLAMLISIIVVIMVIVGVGLLGKAVEEQQSSSPTAGPIDQTDPAQETEGAGTDGSSGDAPAVEGGETNIGTDVTMALSVHNDVANDYAIGAESSNGEIAVVTVTVKNNSTSDVNLSNATFKGSDGAGKDYDDVFDGTKYTGSLPFVDPIPAGGEKTVELAYGVPASEIDNLVIDVTLLEDLGNGTEFSFKKV